MASYVSEGNGVVFPVGTTPSPIYSKRICKNLRFSSIQRRLSRLYYCMKKILLLSAVLLGAVTASQAGVRFSIGIPLPTPHVVITPPAPAYVEPPNVYVEPPPVYAPAPPVVVAPPVLEFGFSRPYYRPYPSRPLYNHEYWHHERDHDWDNHGHGGHDWDHHRR
jgi:hypothetical protein